MSNESTRKLILEIEKGDLEGVKRIVNEFFYEIKTAELSTAFNNSPNAIVIFDWMRENFFWNFRILEENTQNQALKNYINRKYITDRYFYTCLNLEEGIPTLITEYHLDINHNNGILLKSILHLKNNSVQSHQLSLDSSVLILLRLGANPNIDNNSLLKLATKYHDLTNIKYLIREGALGDENTLLQLFNLNKRPINKYDKNSILDLIKNGIYSLQLYMIKSNIPNLNIEYYPSKVNFVNKIDNDNNILSLLTNKPIHLNKLISINTNIYDDITIYYDADELFDYIKKDFFYISEPYLLILLSENVLIDIINKKRNTSPSNIVKTIFPNNDIKKYYTLVGDIINNFTLRKPSQVIITNISNLIKNFYDKYPQFLIDYDKLLDCKFLTRNSSDHISIIKFVTIWIAVSNLLHLDNIILPALKGKFCYFFIHFDKENFIYEFSKIPLTLASITFLLDYCEINFDQLFQHKDNKIMLRSIRGYFEPDFDDIYFNAPNIHKKITDILGELRLIKLIKDINYIPICSNNQVENDEVSDIVTFMPIPKNKIIITSDKNGKELACYNADSLIETWKTINRLDNILKYTDPLTTLLYTMKDVKYIREIANLPNSEENFTLPYKKLFVERIEKLMLKSLISITITDDLIKKYRNYLTEELIKVYRNNNLLTEELKQSIDNTSFSDLVNYLVDNITHVPELYTSLLSLKRELKNEIIDNYNSEFITLMKEFIIQKYKDSNLFSIELEKQVEISDVNQLLSILSDDNFAEFIREKFY